MKKMTKEEEEQERELPRDSEKLVISKLDGHLDEGIRTDL